MVAHAPFTGETTRPTEVKVNRKTDKDGNTTSKTVEYPNDPHIATNLDTAGQRPQTKLSGYAQGGTTNPPEGVEPGPKWFSPDGKEEDSPQPMFERDEAVNPAPHETGPRFAGTSGDAGSGTTSGKGSSK